MLFFKKKEIDKQIKLLIKSINDPEEPWYFDTTTFWYGYPNSDVFNCKISFWIGTGFRGFKMYSPNIQEITNKKHKRLLCRAVKRRMRQAKNTIGEKQDFYSSVRNALGI